MDREVTSVLYRYLLDHEVDGSDAEHLIDALEDEEFAIRELLGEENMVASIREGLLHLEIESQEPLSWFGECIRTLSVYLSEYVSGLEVAEGRNRAHTRVEVDFRRYVSRCGDLIVVPLTHTIAFPSGEITPGPEDVAYLEAHWSELPRWAHDAYRLKFPYLRRL